MLTTDKAPGSRMVTVDSPQHETRMPMAWEEYLALDDVRGEYRGGELVVSAAPGRGHQRIVFDLAKLLEPTLPSGAALTLGWGWSPVGVREELVPDLMVHPPTEEDVRFTGIPLLVVEVVSTNRRADLVEKTTRYAAWGARSYWVLDPRDHEVHAFDHVDGLFVQTAHTSSGQVTLTYGDAAVEVDLDTLLG